MKRHKNELNDCQKKKLKKKIVCIILLNIVILFIAIGIPIIINELYKSGNGYLTMWKCEDALSFYGALISGIGTIVLGIVAWKQNTRLLKLEENTFIADNACSVLVSSVKANKINQNACNLDIHTEQVVSTKEFSEKDLPSSIEFEIKLKLLNGIPVLVNVSDFFACCTLEKEQVIIDAKISDSENSYTRIAIGNDFCVFNLTVLLSKKEKKEFVALITNNKCKVVMDINFTLLTDKYIASNYMCRANLKQSKYQSGLNVELNIDDIEPICFWHGNESISSKDINIKQIE